MSPDLEKLLEVLYEKLTCPPEEKAHRVATFERLLNDAMARRPGTAGTQTFGFRACSLRSLTH